jgi:hypothetical protein
MRNALRLLTVSVVTTVIGTTAVVIGASSVGAPLPVTAATSATTAPRAAGPDYALPDGLTLPHGTSAIDKATTSRSVGGVRRWEVRLDLGAATGSAALDSLAAQLDRAGWQIRRGSHDLFAARQVGARWEIVVARWPAPRSTSIHTLGLGIGSRQQS